MDLTEDYYDFHCGNDARFVKVAIKNNSFHTITIHADVAKTIDFSGGTRKIEVIRLNKCFKATRILWPERTGAIRRLLINHADTLTQLDVSALTSLEELSIVNCMSLEEITGLPATLKEINVHNVKIKTLDLKQAKSLHKLNISTTSATLDLDLNHQNQLQIIYASTKKEFAEGAKGLSLNASNCPILHTIYTDTGVLPVNLDLSSSPTLRELILLCGKYSSVNGLPDCKKLEFFHSSADLKFDEVTKIFINKYQADHAKSLATETSDAKINAIKATKKEFYVLAQKTIPSMYDRETIIQQSGSRKEVDKSRGVKIILLSEVVDQIIDIDENDMMKYKKHIKIDDAFFLTDLQSVYYLPELPFLPNPAVALPAARILSKNNAGQIIPAWLRNKENLIPNLLVIDQSLLNEPRIRSYFKKLTRYNKVINVAQIDNELKPENKIIFTGDKYFIVAALPALAGIITAIPAAAFTTPAYASLAAAPARADIYQDMLSQVSKVLNANNRQVANLATEFFTQISRNIPVVAPQRPTVAEAPGANSAIRRSAKLPEQQPISGNRRYKALDEQQPIGGERVYKEPDEQQPIGGERVYKEPDEQQPIGGERVYKEPDEQQPIGGERAYKEPDEQQPIGGERNHMEAEGPPDDLKPKSALQEPINKRVTSKPMDDIPQHLIDAEAEGPPDDMNPRKALQEPINKKPSNDSLQNVPPMTPDDHKQQLIEKARKHADQDFPEQILIDKSATNKPLLDAEKLITEPVNDQLYLAADLKLVAAAPLQPDQTNEQILLQQLKQALGPLSPSHTNDQSIFNVKKSRKEDMPEQVLINASAEFREASEAAPEHLLAASKKLALALKAMTESANKQDKHHQSKSLAVTIALVDNVQSKLASAQKRESVLDAAEKILIAIETLHHAFVNELSPQEPAPKKRSKVSERNTSTARANLTNILKTKLKIYHEENPANIRNDNMFATGYAPGVIGIRARILKRLIEALDSHEILTYHQVERDLNELMRDDDLKFSLGHLIEPLTRMLTEATPTPLKPSLKDDK